jgi:N6-L-threonylcarbamoyladenine synthase
MLILGIESSCDDTSVALVNCSDTGCFVIAERTASQIDLHKIYGGVVPELAGRAHAEAITPLIEEVLNNQPHPDLIAVTAGPGLVTGLIVGIEAARTLSYAWNIPVVPVNHIDGHIHSVEVRPQPSDFGLQQPEPKSESQSLKSEISFPALALVVSGGHTELVVIKNHDDYTIIGRTHDDAAGECFDKAAKLLDLPYPGGPKISKLAENGRANAIPFPRPMIQEKTYDFSFSGLKTSALYWLRDHSLSAANVNPLAGMPSGIFATAPEPPTLEDFCASFEQAIIDVLVTKTIRAAKEFKPKSILIVGGVSANRKLRETLNLTIQSELSETACLPSAPGYSMDNGAMIAIAGYYKFLSQGATPWQDLDVDPNWRVDQTFNKASSQ